jgi:hypothetical protein
MNYNYIDIVKKNIEEREAWEKNHPVQAFLSDAFDFVFYGIPRYTHEIFLSCKYGFQRMFRGYDDYDVWEYWSANAERTIKILKRFRETKVGCPHTINDPDGVLAVTRKTDEGGNDDVTFLFQKWDEALGFMIEGFEALLAADDVFIRDEHGEYDREKSEEENARLMAIWERGAKLYIANMTGLWD